MTGGPRPTEGPITMHESGDDFFDRAGLAARSELGHPRWVELFQVLDQEQAKFLAHEAAFRSPEYPWPRDPLRQWSRCWEYPYVYHHARQWLARPGPAARPRVLDVGSGVTFFPFALARLGADVICTDVCDIAERDLQRAAAVVPHAPGAVSFRRTDGRRLPLADAEADLVYCISVLEHIPEFERTVAEMARVVRPGGLLLLTVDLDLTGRGELTVEQHRRLLASLRGRFEPVYPETTVHPLDVLTAATGPYAQPALTGAGRAWFDVKQRVIKPLLGRKPATAPNLDLAVQGFVCRRTDAGAAP